MNKEVGKWQKRGEVSMSILDVGSSDVCYAAPIFPGDGELAFEANLVDPDSSPSGY
jgi:hypothetical protein